MVAGGGDVEEVGDGVRGAEVASELDAGEGGGEVAREEAGEGQAVEVSVGDEDEGFGVAEVGD